eukprot:Pgem_evm3s252
MDEIVRNKTHNIIGLMLHNRFGDVFKCTQLRQKEIRSCLGFTFKHISKRSSCVCNKQTGIGVNGKSVLNSLFEQMLGTYSIDLPPGTASSPATPESARIGPARICW